MRNPAVIAVWAHTLKTSHTQSKNVARHRGIGRNFLLGATAHTQSPEWQKQTNKQKTKNKQKKELPRAFDQITST
jgi:hypothetical protein